MLTCIKNQTYCPRWSLKALIFLYWLIFGKMCQEIPPVCNTVHQVMKTLRKYIFLIGRLHWYQPPIRKRIEKCECPTTSTGCSQPVVRKFGVIEERGDCARPKTRPHCHTATVGNWRLRWVRLPLVFLPRWFPNTGSCSSSAWKPNQGSSCPPSRWHPMSSWMIP